MGYEFSCMDATPPAFAKASVGTPVSVGAFCLSAIANTRRRVFGEGCPPTCSPFPPPSTLKNKNPFTNPTEKCILLKLATANNVGLNNEIRLPYPQ